MLLFGRVKITQFSVHICINFVSSFTISNYLIVSDIDPNMMFQTYFNGGGQGFDFSSGGGFPGSAFSFQFG